MTVLLVASSEGRGLKPLTETRCVALLPIAGKPAVVHALESIIAAGLTDVVVSLGPHGDQVRTLLGDGSKWGVQLRYLPTRPGEAVASIAKRVRRTSGAALVIVHAAALRSPAIVRQMVETPMPSSNAHLAARVGGRWAGVDCLTGLAEPSDLPGEPEDPSTWRSDGMPVDLEGTVLLLRNLRSFHRANFSAATGEVDGITPPGFDCRPGVRIGVGSTMPPTSIAGVRIFAGSDVGVHPAALIETDVVLGDGVIIDRGARLARTVVLPNTYVGESVELSDAIVSGGMLIRLDCDKTTRETDSFFLADISRRPPTGAKARLSSQAVGLVLLMLSTPLWLLAFVFALAQSPMRPVRVVALLGNRRVRAKGGRTQPRAFSSLEFATGTPLFRYLPRLWAVVTGDLNVIGVCPLTPDASRTHVEEWERVHGEALSGLFGPGQLARDDSPTERYLRDAIYARTRTAWGDLVWLGRGARALVTPRSAQLAPRHV